MIQSEFEKFVGLLGGLDVFLSQTLPSRYLYVLWVRGVRENCSLHDRRFMSLAGRTRYFPLSFSFLFPSSCASRSCRAPREISRSPRLAHKAPVMQARKMGLRRAGIHEKGQKENSVWICSFQLNCSNSRPMQEIVVSFGHVATCSLQ